MNKDKEPLMSAEQYYDSVNGISYAPLSFAKAYAKYHTEWHLNKVKKVVCDKTKVFANGKQNGAKKEFIIIGIGSFIADKQSITNAIENYIKENL